MGGHGKDPHRAQGKTTDSEHQPMDPPGTGVRSLKNQRDRDLARIGGKDEDHQELRGGQRPGVGSRIEGALDIARQRADAEDDA